MAYLEDVVLMSEGNLKVVSEQLLIIDTLLHPKV